VGRETQRERELYQEPSERERERVERESFIRNYPYRGG
jgi:hypothetical protein